MHDVLYVLHIHARCVRSTHQLMSTGIDRQRTGSADLWVRTGVRRHLDAIESPGFALQKSAMVSSSGQTISKKTDFRGALKKSNPYLIVKFHY